MSEDGGFEPRLEYFFLFFLYFFGVKIGYKK